MDIHSSFKGRSVVLGALVLVCLAPLFASSKIPARLPDRRAIQDPIQATASAQASAPLTTERMVSKPPQITYDDGQLTIVAENSRLSEVMSALRAAMGADIDLPASVAGQRIWVRLGPGPARSVLRDLLDNTELDYVIQASDTDLEGIRSLSLTVRSKTAEQGVPGSRVARGTSRRELPVSSNPVEAPARWFHACRVSSRFRCGPSRVTVDVNGCGVCSKPAAIRAGGAGPFFEQARFGNI